MSLHLSTEAASKVSGLFISERKTHDLHVKIPVLQQSLNEHCYCSHLAELAHDLPQKAVEHGQLSAQVDVALKHASVSTSVHVGDLEKKLLHGGPLHFQELIHEIHVLLLWSESEGMINIPFAHYTQSLLLDFQSGDAAYCFKKAKEGTKHQTVYST